MPDGSGVMHPFLDIARAAAEADTTAGWLSALRRDGAARFSQAGLPARRDEYWRYTNLNALGQADYALAGPDAQASVSACVDAALSGLDGYRIVFINGELRPDPSGLGDLPDGVRLAGLADLLAQDPARVEPWLGRIAGLDGMPLAALNTAFLGDGMVLLIDEGVVLDKPVLLVSVGSPAADGATFQPRNLVVLGDAASATLIDVHVGMVPGARYFANVVTEIALGAGSRLDHYTLQDQAPAAHHIGLTEAQVARGAHYCSFVLQTGAALGRHETRVRLDGSEIDCEVSGIYLGRDGQLLDNTTLVEHLAPACRSRQVFKGVLDGQSRGVFQGKIHVRREAQQTDGHQLSRTLLLSPRAEIDTRPELEIYADDVKCSHGATAGDLDEDTLFYLLSRGIERATARRLLVGAFVADALEHIAQPEIAGVFSARIDGWLDDHISALPDIGDEAL